MRSALVLIVLLAVNSCSLRIGTPADKKKKSQLSKSATRESVLRGYLKKKIPRTGAYSTVTDGFVTTETYRRKDGESIFVLEKGELRVETEARKSGFTLTRTWQEKALTSMTVSGKKRTTLIYLDKDGDFLTKIVTLKDRDIPYCYHYRSGRPSLMDDADCLSLIPDFD